MDSRFHDIAVRAATPAAELCATPYLELVHPEDRLKATDEALDICAGKPVFRYRCKDGSYRWLSWSATPSVEHRLIYASARDVTAVVRMEQGRRAANELLKHANYDYILEGYEGPADCLAALQDSQSAGQRILRLLNNLVGVAQHDKDEVG